MRQHQLLAASFGWGPIKQGRLPSSDCISIGCIDDDQTANMFPPEEPCSCTVGPPTAGCYRIVIFKLIYCSEKKVNITE